MNFTDDQQNTTQLSSQLGGDLDYARIILFTPTFLCFCFFLYSIAVILRLFFRSFNAKESARHVLFAHMLINDTMYLSIGVLLFILFSFPTTLPASLCYLLIVTSSTSGKVTPYNLAAMSLKRFIAICYPLRHGELCTVQRSLMAILAMWSTVLIPNMVDFIIVLLTLKNAYFQVHIRCERPSLTFTSAQDTIMVITNAVTFSSSGLIIIFTYAKVMTVTRKIDSGNVTDSKAGKTIMLHAFQLLLCLMSLIFRIVEKQMVDNVILLSNINFCFFMCLPRLISPLIYGRAELFTYMKNSAVCKWLQKFPRKSSK